MRRFAASFVSAPAAAAACGMHVRCASTAIDKAAVVAAVKSTSAFDAAAVQKAVDHLIDGLAKTDYSRHFTTEDAARHVQGVLTAEARSALGDTFEYVHEGETNAFYICRNEQKSKVRMVRKMARYVGREGRSAEMGSSCLNFITADGSTSVYLANLSPYVNAAPKHGETDVKQLATKSFLENTPAEDHEHAARLLNKTLNAVVPAYEISPGAVQGVTHFVMTTVSDSFNYIASLISVFEEVPNAEVVRCASFSFANGAHIYSFDIRGVTPEVIEERASFVGLLPNRPHNEMTRMHEAGILTCEQTVFIDVAVIFALYFTPAPSNDDYRHLKTIVSKEPNGLNRLNSLRQSLSSEMMSERYMGRLIAQYPQFVREIYEDFKAGSTAERREKIASDIVHQLKEDQKTDYDVAIFKSFLRFNEVIIKHNFFKPDKSALAFRLNPAYLKELNFPRIPYGVFLFAGSQWRGFHIRFTDIARGGVRMIISNESNYRKNKRSVFQENYNLALTQLLKNKDIPEGGSKGTLLVSSRHLNKFDEPRCKRLFLQYVDAMLDVILPGEKAVVDNFKKEEIIFLGPDENTAGGFPAAGALYSKGRNYSAWKSFTTGKDPSMGGIPHDEYGMTTLTVRTNVKAIYKRLGLDETKMRKFQTGGPDGDLGSNEVKTSSEIMVGLVDVSASVHDPNGVNREELLRLATERLPLRAFDRSKLSKDGFLVLTEDRDVTLPDGTFFEHGAQLRDEFHFLKYSDADIFVPCGGRPRSVTLANVGRFLKVPDADGEGMLEGKYEGITKDQLKFQIIVEGANLFISQDARLALERCGVVLIKDATANKGGVTSSSLEVFAGLALDDAEHAQHMCVTDPANPPDFYKRYVQEILERLEHNAELEFDAIWREWEKNPSQPKTLIADALSAKNVDIRANMLASDLFKNEKLVRYVMSQYAPKTLLEVVPVEKLCERVPQNYQHAICAMWLASRFVYSTGMHSNEFDFFTYMTEISNKAKEAGF
uniref:Glutamate dehydrogenase n=1 Tax=Herpetomonas muscarum TaxID=5718 RepID=U5KL65_HERMU|nr:glutamate dehydrogenase [Herpetomonas muscarum]